MTSWEKIFPENIQVSGILCKKRTNGVLPYIYIYACTYTYIYICIYMQSRPRENILSLSRSLSCCTILTPGKPFLRKLYESEKFLVRNNQWCIAIYIHMYIHKSSINAFYMPSRLREKPPKPLASVYNAVPF